jgi:hypothetical protein
LEAGKELIVRERVTEDTIARLEKIDNAIVRVLGVGLSLSSCKAFVVKAAALCANDVPPVLSFFKDGLGLGK